MLDLHVYLDGKEIALFNLDEFDNPTDLLIQMFQDVLNLLHHEDLSVKAELTISGKYQLFDPHEWLLKHFGKTKPTIVQYALGAHVLNELLNTIEASPSAEDEYGAIDALFNAGRLGWLQIAVPGSRPLICC